MLPRELSFTLSRTQRRLLVAGVSIVAGAMFLQALIDSSLRQAAWSVCGAAVMIGWAALASTVDDAPACKPPSAQPAQQLHVVARSGACVSPEAHSDTRQDAGGSSDCGGATDLEPTPAGQQPLPVRSQTASTATSARLSPTAQVQRWDVRCAAATASCAGAATLTAKTVEGGSVHRRPGRRVPPTASPNCTLTAASALSASVSHEDSGFSNAPGSLMESIAMVASLSKPPPHYRSVLAGCRGTLHLKIPHIEPSDLPCNFVDNVNAALQSHGAPHQVVGAYVRRGCVELALDLVTRAGQGPEGQWLAGATQDDVALSLLVLSALGLPPQLEQQQAEDVLVQCGRDSWAVGWSPAAAEWRLRAGAGAGEGAQGEAVEWEAGTSSAVGGGSRAVRGTVVMMAPAAVLAPAARGCGQATEAAGGAVAFSVLVYGAVDWGQLAGAGAAPGDEHGARGVQVIARANGRTVRARVVSVDGSVPGSPMEEQQRLRGGGGAGGSSSPTGPSAPTRTLHGAAIGGNSPAATNPAPGLAGVSARTALAAQGAGVMYAARVHLEVDVGALAGGHPGLGSGRVVRLELWEGSRVLDSVHVACVTDPRVAAELLLLQRWEGAEAAAAAAAGAGGAGGAAAGTPGPIVSKEDTEQLMWDLVTWLDLVAFHGARGAVGSSAAAAAAAAGSQGPDRRDNEDLSNDLLRLFASPDLQECALAAGQSLLRHFVHNGCTALAGFMYSDMLAVGAPVGGLLSSAGLRAAELPGVVVGHGGMEEPELDEEGGSDPLAGVTLLHMAVRSGRRDMVAMVCEWAAACGCADGVWCGAGPGGLTPLHLLAAEAHCGDDGNGARRLMAAAEGAAAAPSAAETLLRWVVGTCPEAVTAWNTARDDNGNTPAALWAAMGGQDIQAQAAAAALEAVVDTLPEPHAPRATASSIALEFPPAAPDAATTSDCLPAPAAPATTSEITTTGAATTTDPATQGAAATPTDVSTGSTTSAAPATLRQALRACWWGFSSPEAEARYVRYVTRTTAPSAFVWMAVMAVAHVVAFFKSLSYNEQHQVFIGGSAYVAGMAMMLLAPAAYERHREPLMMCCITGRIACRFCVSLLPAYFRMSENVVKYVVYGLDILLDGLLEGSFEQMRVPYVLAMRIIEVPSGALLRRTHGVCSTWGASLLRSVATSLAGCAMTAFMDLRNRAAFLRQQHRQQGAQPEAKKAQ